MLPVARRLLADWDNAEELMRQHFTLQLGKVSIAAMPSFAGNLLPAVLRRPSAIATRRSTWRCTT